MLPHPAVHLLVNTQFLQGQEKMFHTKKDKNCFSHEKINKICMFLNVKNSFFLLVLFVTHQEDVSLSHNTAAAAAFTHSHTLPLSPFLPLSYCVLWPTASSPLL
jgi:hypothetical protein